MEKLPMSKKKKIIKKDPLQKRKWKINSPVKGLIQTNHPPNNNQYDSQKTVEERMTHDYLKLELPK